MSTVSMRNLVLVSGRIANRTFLHRLFPVRLRTDWNAQVTTPSAGRLQTRLAGDWPDLCGNEGCTEPASWRLIVHSFTDCQPRGGDTQLDANGDYVSFCCDDCYWGWRNNVEQMLHRYASGLPIVCETCDGLIFDLNDIIHRVEPRPVEERTPDGQIRFR